MNILGTLRIIVNGCHMMKKKFKPGDRVYHGDLKQYRTFVDYAWESEEEYDVDFETEDGEMELGQKS